MRSGGDDAQKYSYPKISKLKFIYRDGGRVSSDGSEEDSTGGVTNSGADGVVFRQGSSASGRGDGTGEKGSVPPPSPSPSVGGRRRGSKRYNIPSSELKKLDQLFVSEDDKLTYDRRQTPSYTAGIGRE